MKLKELLTRLPVVSMFYYLNRGRCKDDKKGVGNNKRALKMLGHMAYAMVPLSMVTVYSVHGVFTKEWNPLKQLEARRQTIQLVQEQN